MLAMTDHLPLSLRRSRRTVAASRDRPTEIHTHTPQTPSRRKEKRVRFSDPGLYGDAVTDEDDHGASTGLTPFMRRTKLNPGPGPDGAKRRRHSGPAASTTPTRPGALTPDRDTGYSGQVTFVPLRQVLDGRVKRRIRRNGLSEEIHVISAQKKRREEQTRAEVEALRAAVAAKDAELRRLSGATEVAAGGGDDEGIDDLKKQAEQLRRALMSPAPSKGHDDSGLSDSTQVDYDQASGHCLAMDVDFDEDPEHFFDESTIAELACSTPTRRRADARHSFPTPPSTSPLMRLVTPPMRQLFTPTSSAGVQVEMPDDERQRLEEELASLRRETGKLTGTLETYEAMTSRLSDKLAPFAPEGGSAAEAILGSRSPAVKVEAQLNKLLEALADGRTQLAGLDGSLRGLGFAGADAPEMVSALSAAFRSARLELEYLEPGESALPLTASGAAVLDLLLARLRELAREKLEHEDNIDEYHAVEASLRRQLGARVGAMDDMRQEIGTLKGKVKLRNARIAELEAGMDKLRGTVKACTRDIAELEGLAQRLEGDLDRATKELQKVREDQEADDEELVGVLRGKNEAIALLEEKLGVAVGQTSALKEELEGLQARHEELQERHQSLDQQHGSELALRDTRVSELRAEADQLNDALREAHEATRKLQVENGSLGGQLHTERSKTKAVFETMRSEFERVVRMGENLVSAPTASPIKA